MNGLQTTSLAVVATWLGLLTFAVLLCIRQLAILTERVDASFDFSPADDGLPIGASVPTSVLTEIGDEAEDALVVFLSATCKPCRETAVDLDKRPLGRPLTVLVAGADDLADEVVSVLPISATVIRDPLAHELATDLNIKSTPFAMTFAHGVVAGKTYVKSSEDIERLTTGGFQVDRASSNGSMTAEVTSGVH
jgi:hypothetical protein